MGFLSGSILLLEGFHNGKKPEREFFSLFGVKLFICLFTYLFIYLATYHLTQVFTFQSLIGSYCTCIILFSTLRQYFNFFDKFFLNIISALWVCYIFY